MLNSNQFSKAILKERNPICIRISENNVGHLETELFDTLNILIVCFILLHKLLFLNKRTMRKFEKKPITDYRTCLNSIAEHDIDDMHSLQLYNYTLAIKK